MQSQAFLVLCATLFGLAFFFSFPGLASKKKRLCISSGSLAQALGVKLDFFASLFCRQRSDQHRSSIPPSSYSLRHIPTRRFRFVYHCLLPHSELYFSHSVRINQGSARQTFDKQRPSTLGAQELLHRDPVSPSIHNGTKEPRIQHESFGSLLFDSSTLRYDLDRFNGYSVLVTCSDGIWHRGEHRANLGSCGSAASTSFTDRTEIEPTEATKGEPTSSEAQSTEVKSADLNPEATITTLEQPEPLAKAGPSLQTSIEEASSQQSAPVAAIDSSSSDQWKSHPQVSLCHIRCRSNGARAISIHDSCLGRQR